MYTAGLNPFYASNFSLWSAYCASGFSMDTMKKPGFCISDILQVDGENLNLTGSPSALLAHMGPRTPGHSSSGSPLRPSPVALDPAVFGGRVNPGSPYHHRHGIHLTSLSRGALSPQGPQQGPPPSSKDLKFGIDRILSTDFDPKTKETSSLRDLTSIVSSSRQSGVLVQPSPASHYYTSIDHNPTMDQSTMMNSLNSHRHAGQFQDSFPGPYAVLTKDTMPQTYKRKRSWSRAVFSNLQRKGLEKRFEIQKYVTKPDRKQLAAMLGLTDAQVKVWFQNRRMKWRHSKEAQAQKDKEKEQTDSKTEEAEEAKDPEESECESEGSESEFEEGHEDRSDVDNLSEHNKTSVIMNGAPPPGSSTLAGATPPVSTPEASDALTDTTLASSQLVI